MRNLNIRFLAIVALIAVSTFLLVNKKEIKIPESKNQEVIEEKLVPTNEPTSIPAATKTITQSPQPQKENLPILNGGNIFSKINSYRNANGKPSWLVSDELCRLAESRADFMIQPTYEDFMKNTYPAFKNHPGFQDMARAFNYSGKGLSENLAMGAKSDDQVITIWKNSSSHNALMLATDHNGINYTKACVATRVKYYGSITVLLVGDI